MDDPLNQGQQGESLEIEDFQSVPSGTAQPVVVQAMPTNTYETDTHVQHQSLFRGDKKAIFLTVAVLLFMTVSGAGTLLLTGKKQTPGQKLSNAAANYGVVNVPLQGLQSGASGAQLGKIDRLSVNGQLQVSNTLVVSPTNAPKNATAGQIYYDKNANAPFYFNGQSFVSLAPAPTTASVTSLAGATGSISVGAGLQVTAGQLSLSPAISQFVSDGAVKTVQGQSGDIVLSAGSGISINGTTISSTAITGVTGGTGLAVTQTGSVVNVSLPQLLDASATPTFAGINLDAPLGVANGGTGLAAASLVANSVVITNSDGTGYELTTPTAAGQCLISDGANSNKVTFGSCTGATTNGVQGIKDANGNTVDDTITLRAATNSPLSVIATSASDTITVDLSYNSTNLQVANGQLNTVQSINQTATPTFAGLALANGANKLTVSAAPNGTQTLAIPSFTGNNNLCINIANSCSAFQAAGSYQAAGNYVDLQTGTPGSAQAGNINVTGTIAAGTLTASTLNSYGSLSISAGGTNQNVTLQGSGTGTVIIKTPQFTNVAGAIYSFNAADPVGTNATICTSVGNCVGASGGGVVSSGTANAIPVFGSDGYHLANSILSQNAGATILNINGASVIGNGALSITAGGTNQSLTLAGSGTGQAVITNPNFKNTNGASYTFSNDPNGTNATICTTAGNCTGASGGGVVSAGTANKIAMYGADGYHFVDSVLSQNAGATVLTVAIPSIVGNGALSITAGGTNQNLTLAGSGSGVVSVTNNLSVGGTINNATVSGGSLTGGAFSGGSVSGGTVSGGSLDATSVNGLKISATLITAGGTNQNLTLQGSGTGSVIINTPNFHNAAGATYAFSATDGSTTNATICTTAGNCTGASGGGVVSTGTANSLAVFSSDGYHLANSILSQDAGATTVTVNGNLVATGTVNGATISGGNISGGSFNGASISGGSLSATMVNGLNVSGSAISGGASGLSISAGGTDQNLILQGTGTGVVAVVGDLTATGTINADGAINGATIYGGSLTSSSVNGLNLSTNSISAGDTNADLTLQGNGTGMVSVIGNFAATGTVNGATISGGNISGGSFNGANITGGSLSASAVNDLSVSGSAITGIAGLSVAAGGTNQNLTLAGSGTGAVVIKNPTFNNPSGATYKFDVNDPSGTSATICTTAGNCNGGSGGGVVSTGTSNNVPLFGSDANHLVNSILSQNVAGTLITAAGNLAATGTINGATITGGSLTGGSVSGGTLSGGTVSGGTLTSTAVNGLSVSSNSVTGDATGLTISAGGTNQSLTLQGTGTGGVIIKNPSLQNANGATYTFASDPSNTTATICTSLGNCTGASGGGVVSSGTANSIAVFGADGYHLANSILSQDAGATALTVNGASITGNGALALSAGGTNQNLTLKGSGTGSVVVTVPVFKNANGATYAFNSADGPATTATICTTAGNCTGSSGGGVDSTGSSNTIAMYGADGYHFVNSILSQDFPATTVSVGGKITASGTINNATISGGTLSGGTFTGGSVSGGSVTATGVNNVNVNNNAISATGTDQDLKLQGSGTGAVAVTGKITASGTINNATISGGTLSGGTFTGGSVSGGSLTATSVNNLNVSGTAISTSGTNQSLTVQGSGTGAVIIKVPSFKNALGATYSFDATDAVSTNATICTTVGNCVGGASGGVASSGSANSIPVFSSDGYHLGNSLLSQDFPATTVTLSGKLSVSSSINNATISGGTLSGGTFTGGSVSGGSLTATSVNNLNVSSTAITSPGAFTIGVGGTNQNLSLQATGTGAVAVTGRLTASGTINGAAISGGTLSGGTFTGGSVSGGTLTTATVNGLNVSPNAISGDATGLTITAGGTNQNLTLQGTGTGVVGVTGKLTTTDTINNATISGGSLTATSVNNLNVSGTAVSGTGDLSISAGGTDKNLTLQGTGTGSVIIKVPSFKNILGATYSFDATDASGTSSTICTTRGNCVGGSGGGVASTGTANNIPVYSSDGYHLANSILSQDAGATLVTIAGKLVTTGTVNGATISGGTLSGGTFTGGSVSGGSVTGGNLSATSVNNTNIANNAISATGTDQNLTLQGSGTGLVAVTGKLTTSGSINNAAISGGTLSGGTFTGGSVASGTFTDSSVNGLGVATNSVTAGGANQNLSLQGNGTGRVVVAGGLTISTGSVAISTLATAGVVHNDGSGVLSSSLIVNADLSAGSFANITGVGTLSAGLNITAGQTYKIGSTDINTAGTLNNVAYLNGTQSLTGNNTFSGSGNNAAIYGVLFKNTTNSTTAFSVQNVAGTNFLGVDTTNGKVAIGAAPSSTGQTLQVTGSINATAGLYTGSTTGVIRLDGSGNLQNTSIALNSTVKIGSTATALYTDGNGVVQGLALSGGANQCLGVNGTGTALIFSTCSGSGGGTTGYQNGGNNLTGNVASACGPTATTQISTSFADAITNPVLGLCSNNALDITTNNKSRINISAGGDIKFLSNDFGGSNEKFSVRTYNDGNSVHYFNTLRVDTANDFAGRVGIGLLVGTAPQVRLDLGGNVNGQTISNGGIQIGGTAAPGLSNATSQNAGSDSAINSGRIYFDAASGKFKVSEAGGGWVNLVASASSNPVVLGGNNSPASTVVLGNTYANGNGGLLIGTSTNGNAIGSGFRIDSNGNYTFDKPYNDSDQYGFKINGSGTDAFHVDTRNNVVAIGGINTNSTSAYGALIVGGNGIMSTGGFRVGTGSEDVGIDATCSSSQQTIDAPTFKKGILVKYGGCRANNSDLAEAYNSTDTLAAGELVMASGTSVTSVNRANNANGTNGLMGIVSTAPSQTLGTAQVPNGYPIALSGRVPTKVNTEGGAIQVGDKITISSVAGVGKKATGSGMIVGTAMESYNGSGTGSIEVFVNLSYYDASDRNKLQAQSGEFGDLNVSGTATIGTLRVTGDATIEGKLTVTSVEVGTLTVNGHIITRGDQPTVAATGATATVTGNDTAGTITVQTGATGMTAGDVASLTFAKAFEQAPHTNLTPTSSAAAGIQYYYTPSATGFTLKSNTALAPNTTYTYSYWTAQ